MTSFIKTIRSFFFLCCIALAVLAPSISYGDNNSNSSSAQRAGTANIPIGETICSIVNQLTGKLGRGVATLAIIFLAIGVILGKINWGLAVAVAIAIAAIFGSDKIIQFVSSDASGTTGCSTNTNGQSSYP